MNDVFLFILVIAGAFIIILGIPYLMDQRRKSKNQTASVPTGPIGRIILQISYGILAITILSIIGAFVFNEILFAIIARNLLFLYIITGVIYRIAKPRGL